MEEIHDDGSPTDKTFEHVPTEIGAEEAEEVEFLDCATRMHLIKADSLSNEYHLSDLRWA